MKRRYSVLKPGPNGERPWTKREDALLHEHYVREGARATREALAEAGFERSTRAIFNRAHRLMIQVGDIDGYVPVSSLYSGKNQTQYYRALFLACKDGVLMELPNKRLKYLVPIEWADKWFEKRLKDIERSDHAV